MSEKEIVIDGNKIRYVEKKGGDESVFIFLHGWNNDHTIFSPLYRNTDTMVAFDFPGFGGSSSLKEVWGLKKYAEVTKNFIGKIADNRKIIFVVHSFGGRVLLKMLNEGTVENIWQIICIGVPFTRRHGVLYEFLCGFSKIAGSITAHLPESVVKKVRRLWHKVVSAEDYGALKNEAMKKTFKGILNEDMMVLAGVLKNYKTDFIWGDNDTAAPLSDAALVAEELGVALHIIKDGDHFPFLGKTEERFMEIFKQITQV